MGEEDVRGYVNPYVPGGLAEASQRSGMTGEVYVEDRYGKQADSLIRSIRKGSLVQVHELFYLAPGAGKPRQRRKLLVERVDAILERGGDIIETSTGFKIRRRGTTMSMRAAEQIASSGRARKHDRPGRPRTWELTTAERDVAELEWRSRHHQNDEQRTLAVQRRINKAVSRAWLRLKLGSPHGR